MEPTLEFRLITFPDVVAVPFSTARIRGKDLKDRIVFARTRSGKYAKFHVVRDGAKLQIIRLTLYDSDGTVLPPPAPFVVGSGKGCDLEKGVETGFGQGDFGWIARRPRRRTIVHGMPRRLRRPARVPDLIPEPGATFATFVEFETLDHLDARQGPWSADRVEGGALKHQIIFCQIGKPGRKSTTFAKLLVEIDSISLIVKRLVVWSGQRLRPKLVLDVSNIRVPPLDWLDLETGHVGPSGHLWWNVVTITEWYLTPQTGTMIAFPSYYAFAKYLPLLRDPDIQSALAFERPAYANFTYAYWQEELKLQLDEYLYLLETNRPLPISGPPPVQGYPNMPTVNGRDARKAYLAHVAQSLWVDANQRVAWRLSRNATELEYLLDSRRLLSMGGTDYYFNTMGRVTAWNPQAAYAFLENNGLIGADQFSTIKRFADWCRSNLEHFDGYPWDKNGPFANEWDQFQWYYGYAGFPPVERVLAPPAGKPHVTAGCWGTSGLFAGVLRAANIPVRHGRTNLSDGIHSRPEFFSVGQNLVHGDDPYSRLLKGGYPTPLPIEKIFADDSFVATKIDNPAPLPGKTVPETTDYNYYKRHWDLGVQYKTQYLLSLRCFGQPPLSNRWQNELSPYYSATRIAQIGSDCDTVIAALGGCANVPPL